MSENEAAYKDPTDEYVANSKGIWENWTASDIDSPEINGALRKDVEEPKRRKSIFAIQEEKFGNKKLPPV